MCLPIFEKLVQSFWGSFVVLCVLNFLEYIKWQIDEKIELRYSALFILPLTI